VARYGGEEFVVLLEADEAEARALAERSRSRISELVMPGLDHSRKPPVTVSIGVAAMYPALSDADPMALIAAADAALLTAKQTGRNRVVVRGETARMRAGTLAPALRSSA
jgi:diguanylate cyclase (GGDEF)-like protein